MSSLIAERALGYSYVCGGGIPVFFFFFLQDNWRSMGNGIAILFVSLVLPSLSGRMSLKKMRFGRTPPEKQKLAGYLLSGAGISGRLQ